MNAGEGQNWGAWQWGVTFLTTVLASGGAFLWRLMLRIEKLESDRSRHEEEIEAMRNANDATMLRLAERFGQLHEDHFRLREAMATMPTRADLRDLEERLAARVLALGERLDRVIDG